jgi:regulator of protease activity HflC (stomatin/prohibitin superfamily)
MSEQLNDSIGSVGPGHVIAAIILAVIIMGALSWVGFDVGGYVYIVVGVLAALFLATGIRVVRPTHRAIVERLGKFHRIQGQGLTWIIPFVDKAYAVNITERMTDAEKQEIITSDNLNATVAALIRYKVKADDESVKKSQYAVNNYTTQIVQLARTTLRNVIGTKPFSEVNSNRAKLNSELKDLIGNETEKWGIEIVTFELKEIEPPKNVQETMNAVIQANNKKTAAKDLAEAAKIEAEGLKNAAIEKASGDKQAFELRAQGEAAAIKTIADANAKRVEVESNAATQFFKDEAIELKKLEITRDALKDNAKIVITQDGITPTLVLGETGQPVIPVGTQRPGRQ